MSRAIAFSDRIRGCLIAGAIGDAMGVPYEGQPGPVAFQEPQEWRISDDTQLTLATCEAIVGAGCVDPELIAAGCVRWFRERRITGIGASTLKALRDLEAGQHWALAGARGEMAAGNGAAMRIAPLAFALNPREACDRQLLRDVCRITHHHEEAYVGALAVCVAIRGLALHETSPADLLAHVVAELPDSRVRDRLIEIRGRSDRWDVLEMGRRFGSSGYVVESVPLALVAAQHADAGDLESVLRQGIQPGGDTDTIASIAGQIAGTALGFDGIPGRLFSQLPNRDWIQGLVNAYAQLMSSVLGADPDGGASVLASRRRERRRLPGKDRGAPGWNPFP